jgi:hypothetical protein
VVLDEHVTPSQLDVRKRVIVGGGVSEESRTDSQERDVEGPNILEGRLDREDLFPTHEGFVGVSRTVKGEKLKDRRPKLAPDGGREDKKKADVGKKRNDENVHEEDASRERERAHEDLARLNLSHGLLERPLPEHLEGNLATYEDT